MSAIDVHTHAFPDDLAARAIAQLQERNPSAISGGEDTEGCSWKSVGDGTIGGLMESMDAADIDISVVCAIATKPDQVKGILKWCERIRGDRIEPFPSLHPDTPKPAKWIKRFAGKKFAGIKLHPMYQDFAIDEERMDPIYAAACEHGLVVAMHCGLDIAFPPDDLRASPERVARVIDRFPELTLICTHMGGWRSWDEVERYIIGRDVYLETSFALDEIGRDRARSMIRRHGEGRVMLGSDWPWTTQSHSIRKVRRLGLDGKTTEAILWSNAAKLLGY